MMQLRAPVKTFGHRPQEPQAQESALAPIFRNLRSLVTQIQSLRRELKSPVDAETNLTNFEVKSREISGQFAALEENIKSIIQQPELISNLSKSDVETLKTLKEQFNILIPTSHKITIDERIPEFLRTNLKDRLRGLTIALGQMFPSGMQAKAQIDKMIALPGQETLIHSHFDEAGFNPLSNADLVERLESIGKKLARAAEAVSEPKSYETSSLIGSGIKMNDPTKRAAVTLLVQLISNKPLFPTPSSKESFQLLDIEQISSSLTSVQRSFDEISHGFRISNAEPKTLRFLKADLDETMLKLAGVTPLPDLPLSATDHISVDHKNSIWLFRSKDQAQSFALRIPAEIFKQLGFDSEQLKTNPTLVYQGLQGFVNQTIKETHRPIENLLAQVKKREETLRQEKALRIQAVPAIVSHQTGIKDVIDQLPKIRRYLTENESGFAQRLSSNLKTWIHLAKISGAQAADRIIERLREARRKFQEARKDRTDFATAIRTALLAKAEDQIHKVISSSITYLDKGVPKSIKDDHRLLQELAI